MSVEKCVGVWGGRGVLRKVRRDVGGVGECTGYEVSVECVGNCVGVCGR